MRRMFDGGSFRDPRGRVFQQHGRVFRTLSPEAAADFRAIKASGLLDRLMDRGSVVRTSEPDDMSPPPGSAALIEHERIDFISYPYEWPFSALKAAALHHLDVQIALLDAGFSLSDATAYNIQFRGTIPVFIDIPSIRPYRDGEYWFGHQQFMNQFLNPLLLDALAIMPYHRWYRGELEGISGLALDQLLKARHRMRPSVLMHVTLPAKLQRLGEQKAGVDAARAMRTRQFPKRSYVALLQSLRRIIARLESDAMPAVPWRDYTTLDSYTPSGFDSKRAFVADFVTAVKPASLLDIGCNTGSYSELALRAGARSVIGIEQDAAAAEAAFQRAKAGDLNLLPIVMDLADASPSQGWLGLERRSFADRACFDGLLALAVEHHLAIGRNIPFEGLIRHIIGLAPQGVIEFVPNSDPQTQRLLRLRDIEFTDHTAENFLTFVGTHARIARQETVAASGRLLVWYDRSTA